MISISGISGEITKFDVSDATLWEIATKVKRELGIPKGEQKYYRGCELLSKSMRIQGPVEITMIRSPVNCGGCGRARKSGEYRLCGKCLDVCYCDEICQRQNWNCHKMTCMGKKIRELDHEHKYKKVYPNGQRDNNEYDLVCDCGHVV
jgi:hypothetical protein